MASAFRRGSPPLQIELTAKSAHPELPSAPWAANLSWLAPLLEAISRVVIAGVVLAALLLYRDDLRNLLLHSSRVEIYGVKFEGFHEELISASKQQREAPKEETKAADITESSAAITLRKLKLAASDLQGLRVLWVDDHPENNFVLRRILTSFGTKITTVLSNSQAFSKVLDTDFDIVITDNKRDRDNHHRDFGKELVQCLVSWGYGASPIVYTDTDSAVSLRSWLKEHDAEDIVATSDPAEFLSAVAEVAVLRNAPNGDAENRSRHMEHFERASPSCFETAAPD